MRLPSFRLCLNTTSVSKFQIIKERMKYNISRDFDLYSLLLDRREFNEKEFIKRGVKIEFYEFTDGWNKNYTKFEEYVETEIHLKSKSKSNEFFYCFSYDTKNLRIQKHLLKSSPFLKISISKNVSYKLSMRLELIRLLNGDNKVYIELNDSFNTVLNSVMKSSVTYLQNPYKSQCSYYDTNQNSFNSEDCYHKCLKTNCFIKYKCVIRDYKFIIRRLDESSFDSNVECSDNSDALKDCTNVAKKCYKICPIDCLSEDNFFTSSVAFHENKNEKVLYYFWDSREPFISYEEIADMLLINYFTYIGGLFALCFGICLESILDLIVKHTRNLRTKVKLQVEKLLLLISILLDYILNSFNDLFVMFMNYFGNNMFRTHNRVESIHL
jgi:hypothetical protein